MKKPDTPKQPDYDELDTILLELAQGSPDHKVSRTEQLLTARGAIHAHYQAKIREAIGEDEYPKNNEQNVNWKRTPERKARDKLRYELRQSLLGGDE